MIPSSPALTAAYDQARASGAETLAAFRASVSQHTADVSPPLAAVTVSLVLADMDNTGLRELIQSALIQLDELESKGQTP